MALIDGDGMFDGGLTGLDGVDMSDGVLAGAFDI